MKIIFNISSMKYRASVATEAVPSVMGSQEDTGAMLAKWRGVQESKTRLKRMNEMSRDEIGFPEIEKYCLGLENKTTCRKGQGRLERKILHLSMRKKIEDEKGKLRRS